MITFFIALILIAILTIPPIIFGLPGFVVGLVFCIIIASASIKIVLPQTIRTVEFLGKFTRVLRQGFHLIIPFIEWTRIQELYRKNFTVEVSGVTSDNVTAYVGLNVIFYVDDDRNDTSTGSVYNSVYSIDDPKTMMKSTIDEQLRGMIINFTHKEIFGKREEIGEVIEAKLREKLSQFGYRIDSIQVRDVNLEQSVMDAMNKVVESEKLKEATYNEAEANKILKVKEAEAEKESKILLGEGMAGQRMAIAKGFSESVDLIREADKSLTGDKILAFLLDSSRIETLGAIGSKGNSKLIYLNEDMEGRGGKLIAGSDLI